MDSYYVWYYTPLLLRCGHCLLSRRYGGIIIIGHYRFNWFTIDTRAGFIAVDGCLRHWFTLRYVVMALLLRHMATLRRHAITLALILERSPAGYDWLLVGTPRHH